MATEAPRSSWTHPVAAVRDFATRVGPVGLLPVTALAGLAAAERFDALAFGVLAPNIRDQFHLDNSEFLAIATLTSVLPLLMAVPIGNWADRSNRIQLSKLAAVIWAVSAVFTGLAPAVAVLIIARLVGGIGQTVNQPVHSSLLSDWYAPVVLSTVFTVYLLGSTGVGLLGSPLSGVVAAVSSWRVAFVALALPTIAFVFVLNRLKEPARGESTGTVSTDNDHVSMAEGFRRVRAIRSLQRTWWAAFFFGAGVASFASLVSLYLKDVFHEGPAARGVVTGVGGVIGLAGFVLAERMSRKGLSSDQPERLPVVNGLMVLQFAAAMALMGFSPWEPVAIAFAIILNIGASGFLVPYQTMVALVAPPRLRAQAFAWSLIFFTMGAIIFAPIVGAVGDAHGQRAAVVVLAIAIGIGGAIEISAKRFVRRDVAEALKGEQAAASTALLACLGLDVAYGQVQILFGVDLEVNQGEIVALLGTNGAGKSTLLRAISGLVDPVGGAIFCNGRDITHADANTTAGLGIVQVPGGRGVFPTLKVGENLRAAAWMFRGDRDYVREATERVLDLFPILRDRWDTEAGSLSGGEQQMLSLGQAFLARPKVLLIDELSLGLAPAVVQSLLKIVQAIHDNGTTIVLVEQSVNLALQIADRAVFMEKGEIRFSGPTAELLDRPDILRAVFLQGAEAGLSQGGGGDISVVTTRDRTASASTNGDGDSRRVVLSTRGVTRRYRGILAVNDVDLDLYEGEILGIIGPNGAGKTTLFDLICGFTAMDGGRVELLGRDVTQANASARARAGLSLSFQDARLWPSLTVREAIAAGSDKFVQIKDPLAAMFRIPAAVESEKEVDQRTEVLIELLGLGAFRDKFISELSTGSRRIVEIATILGQRPSVVLLDEPSSGIAQRETEALGPLLKQVQQRLGCSMLIIEHDMPLITSVADELIALHRGEVMTRGTPDEVLQHPAVVESYLGTDATQFHIGRS
jgi:ABC-type branched-subunit amino acid transport system ATPase component/predicted MFS family arabinose efflux permease